MDKTNFNIIFALFLLTTSCGGAPVPSTQGDATPPPEAPPVMKPIAIAAEPCTPQPTDTVVSREAYLDKLQGFWMGQCISNFTGRVTEMDKVGDTHDFQTMPFYTRDDWGKPDQPAIWAEGKPSDLSPTIDFVIRSEGEVWDADDDTDLEYIYQYLLHTQGVSLLTGEQIRDGWLAHIWEKEENFLWGGNQESYTLMQKGVVPPQTGDKDKNPNWYYIDAQLTTEIFGLYAPSRPDVARQMALLPIRTVAREDAQWIAEFYVSMHALASSVDTKQPLKEQVLWLAEKSRHILPDDSYSAGMYDFVMAQYQTGSSWEQARDALYKRYQLEMADGYDVPGMEGLYCAGCFAAGINFGASMVSLLWGEGDIVETTKIGALAGWDSDNPTSTWGGLLGFLIGKEGVEAAFGQNVSTKFNIHHTRQGFPNDGMDDFAHMAQVGIEIIDRVVIEEMGGQASTTRWCIPTAEGSPAVEE